MRAIGAERSLYHYQAYGFAISSDVALPAGEAEPDDGPALPITKANRIEEIGEVIGPFAQAGEDWIAFSVPGIVQFHVSRKEGIRYVPHSDGDLSSVATFLLNSALPCAAMLAGKVCIRGTALEKDAETLLLIGLPAKGKSSTAAALVQQGYSILSDGICAFDAEGQLHPGFATLTLPRDAARELALPDDQLMPTRPSAHRFHWPQATASDAACRSIASVYQILVRTVEDIEFADVRGAEQLKVLRACAFRSDEVTRLGLQASMLSAVAGLSASATFRRVWRPVKDTSPADLALRILDDVRLEGSQA